MASLNHVCMWTEHGWQRITAEEASALHPGGTVSAHSGLFMCELCGQYVILTDGYERVRYFKHSASEADKLCPERTFGASYTQPTYQPGEHELPLRLTNLTANGFSLEIGFLFVPLDILRKTKQKTITIQPSELQSGYQYSFERLNSDTITYLSVGDIPARSYQISVDPVLNPIWPKVIHGVDSAGAVFAASSGRKLGLDSDVQVNRTYYYLRSGMLLASYPHVRIKEVCRKTIDFRHWYVYEVTATAYEADAARFFLDLHCRLTDAPAHIQAVWPPYAESPYVIRHSQNRIYIHIRGQNGITAKTFPSATNWKFSCPGEGMLLELDCKGRQQLISAGRSHVQQYTYLWKEPLNRVTDLPTIRVCDIRNHLITAGTGIKPPEQEQLLIHAPFDGWVMIFQNHTLITKIKVKADHDLNLTQIGPNTEVQILQGLDLVWKGSFGVSMDHSTQGDRDFVRKLDSYHGSLVPLPHTAGAWAQKLKQFPETRQWLYRRIRQGTISADALRSLRHFLRSRIE